MIRGSPARSAARAILGIDPGAVVLTTISSASTKTGYFEAIQGKGSRSGAVYLPALGYGRQKRFQLPSIPGVSPIYPFNSKRYKLVP